MRPKLMDLPIRRVRRLEPYEYTAFRVSALPLEWQSDTRPAHPETGVFTIEEVMLSINEEMSIVPPLRNPWQRRVLGMGDLTENHVTRCAECFEYYWTWEDHICP